MFDNDRYWLENQPQMQPWDEGCGRLSVQLGDWTADYSALVCDETVADGHPGHTNYLTRLWGCWSHHWEQAAGNEPIEGSLVAQQIQSGQGYQRGKSLGGDPLRDVVLAVAMTDKENRAAQQFEADYFEYAKNLSGKVNPRFRDDADDWWNEFLDYLAGYTKPPGKLHRYVGKCALRNWLGTVLWNFLRRRPLPAGANMEEPIPTNPEQTVEEIAQSECVELFGEIIEAALAELDPQERLLLALLYIDGLKGKEAAAILGVHPGQITRKREAALTRLRELTAQHATAMERSDSFQDCLELLPGSQADFATALIEALKRQRGEEDKR